MTYQEFKEKALNLHIKKFKIPFSSLVINDKVLDLQGIKMKLSKPI